MWKLRPAADHCFYWELHEGHAIQAVRWDDWKAVRNAPSRPIELYNLKTDVGETKDLAAEHPDLVKKAESLMRSERTADPAWPLAAKKPREKAAKK
ncbi:MAG: hypothetical protein K9N23_08250 [Akkermansiaceae bacterium]|nr:hypothetical protein [Akkermansiaceae bacterium]MCF7731665.1 hypothetical protein [Akkermansiaceae bacterium]